MAMTRNTGYSSISIGIIELFLGGIAVICGIVSMSKLTNPVATTIGIWALFFAIPGILCVLAGIKNDTTILGISLGMNVIGIILAAVATLLGGLFWTILNHTCYDAFGTRSDGCTCAPYGDDYNTNTYAASCSDLMVIRNATGVATIMFVLLIVTSLIGSILGCVGTCCAPRDTHVIVTQAGQPGTVVVTSNQQHTTTGYPAQYSYPAGVQQGYPAGVQQGYPAGVQQGYPAGVQQGYSAGAQQGYTAEMAPPGYDECNAGVQYPTK